MNKTKLLKNYTIIAQIHVEKRSREFEFFIFAYGFSILFLGIKFTHFQKKKKIPNTYFYSLNLNLNMHIFINLDILNTYVLLFYPTECCIPLRMFMYELTQRQNTRCCCWVLKMVSKFQSKLSPRNLKDLRFHLTFLFTIFYQLEMNELP